MQPKRRRILLADWKLQGILLSRTVIYWCYCLCAISLIAMCWTIVTTRPTSSSELGHHLWMHIGPALIGSLFLIPIVLMDCLRLSNRFAGPMIRLQRAMGELAEGQIPQHVQLRKGDFWTEFAANLNRVIDRMESARGEGTFVSSVESVSTPMSDPTAEVSPSK